MFDIAAVGELLIDFTPESAPGALPVLYSQNPGGAPGNVLAAAAALGAKTALISRVGDDAFGRFLIDAVQRQGIDASGVGRDRHAPTTLAFVHLDADGDRSFSFYRDPGADLLLRPEHIPAGTLSQSHIFHFGGVSMTGGSARSATLHALNLARQAGCLISYDPNWRPSLWPDVREAARVMAGPLDQVDILKVSEEELPLLSGCDDLEAGSKALADRGVTLVLVSRGPKGAFYRLGNLCGSLPTYEVKSIDTTGAGDAFLGAVLWQLRQIDRAALKELKQAELEEIVDFANAAGSLATTRKGALAVMPTRAEIDACRRSIPKKES